MDLVLCLGTVKAHWTLSPWDLWLYDGVVSGNVKVDFLYKFSNPKRDTSFHIYTFSCWRGDPPLNYQRKKGKPM